MQTIKKMSGIMAEGSGILIVSVLALAGLIESFNPQQQVIGYFIEYFPLLLFGLIAILAQYKGYPILSISILLIVFYPNSFSAFIDAFLQLFANRNIFKIQTFTQFFIGLFLVLMLLSTLMNKPKQTPSFRNIDVICLGIAFTQVFLFTNVIAAINSLLLIIIALLLGSRKLAGLLLMAKFIMSPVQYIQNLIEFEVLSTALHIRSISMIFVLLIIIGYTLSLHTEPTIE